MGARRIAISAVLAAGLATTAATVPAAAEQPATSPVDALRSGRQAFEAACGRCHSVDLPLSKRLDRAGWEQTLGAMTGRGAEIAPAERGLIIEYLSAKSTFEGLCVTCHDFKRAFELHRTREQWEKTVEAMVARKSGAFTAEDVSRIKAYLTLIAGAE